MSNFIRRWISTEDIALRKQFQGKSAEARFTGLNRSERNEAKLLLVSIVPTLPVAMIFPKWSEASVWGQAAMVCACTWFIVVSSVGLFFSIRSIIRATRNEHG